jgi:DNA-directed RNA polymerase specialized sigma24 family protein
VVSSSTAIPTRLLKAEQDIAVVRSAIAELSPLCRRVFVMHRFDGLGYVDIGLRLDLAVPAIEQLVGQALTHLKNRLDAAEARRTSHSDLLEPAAIGAR